MPEPPKFERERMNSVGSIFTLESEAPMNIGDFRIFKRFDAGLPINV